MNQETDKKLDQLLANLPKQQYDMDAWLIEDETETFDRIVSQRRRKVWTWRWIAAAVVVGLFFAVGSMLEKQTTATLPPVAHVEKQEPVSQPLPIQEQEPVLAEVITPKDAAPRAKAMQKKVAATQPATHRMTPIDSLTDIIAHIESSMQGVRDSCYIANVEKLIRVDDRLQRLVNELILEGMVSEPTTSTAFIDSQNIND